eukprot:scaffold12339_cov53-Phaeocystis_antarctica.AAC.3
MRVRSRCDVPSEPTSISGTRALHELAGQAWVTDNPRMNNRWLFIFPSHHGAPPPAAGTTRIKYLGTLLLHVTTPHYTDYVLYVDRDRTKALANGTSRMWAVAGCRSGQRSQASFWCSRRRPRGRQRAYVLNSHGLELSSHAALSS